MPMLANVTLRTQGKNQPLVAATDVNVSLTAAHTMNNGSAVKDDASLRSEIHAIESLILR